MKRFGLVLIASLFLLPMALRWEVRANGVPAQRGDRDRDDLIINRAVYGAGNKQHDITAPLNAEIRDGRLRIQVRNDTMGGDPAKNTPKTLQIWYTFRGRQFMEALNENDFLELPGREAFSPEERDRRDLTINRALYGTGDKQHDITAPLNAEIRDGRLRIQVRNDTMGGDPARNQPKTLQVWFTFAGHQDMIVLRENDYLELPGHWAFDDHDRDRGHR
jgi:hypothetical protein